MKSAEVYLGYFKQGDDMAGCFEECNGNIVEAFKMRADGLEAAAKHLRELAEVINQTGRVKELEMDANTHMVMLHGPDELINMLIDKELVETYENFDEEEEEEYFDDDFDEDEEE